MCVYLSLFYIRDQEKIESMASADSTLANEDIDDFTATYLLGSTVRQLSTDEQQTTTTTSTTPDLLLRETSSSPDDLFTQQLPQQLQQRTMSQVSKDSFDLNEAEREANEFMNNLHDQKSQQKRTRDTTTATTYNKNISNFDAIVQLNSSLKNTLTGHEEQRARLLQNTGSLSRSVNDLSYSPSGSYHPQNTAFARNSNNDGNNTNTDYNNSSNHRHYLQQQKQRNRFSCHDDFDLYQGQKRGYNHFNGHHQNSGGERTLYSSSQRDIPSQLLMQSSADHNTKEYRERRALLNDENAHNNKNDEKIELNELQEKYSRAIHDFKLLRSTLTENMERQLTRTQQIDQLNNNDSTDNKNDHSRSNSSGEVRRSRENSFRRQHNHQHSKTSSGVSNQDTNNEQYREIEEDQRSVISASSANLERIKHHFEAPQYRSQDNIQYQQQHQKQQQQTFGEGDVVLRKQQKQLDYYSSKERLFDNNRRFSEMNLDDKYHNSQQQHVNNNSTNQYLRQQQLQRQHQYYNNNYDMLKAQAGHGGIRPLTYHGSMGGLDSFAMSPEQQREYQSLLRDQAANSNFERYLKGSFNSHSSFDHLNQVETDPGYGGSGSTSPRDIDSSLATTDHMSSRSGSIISRQSQTSTFAASVDSGVRGMSYVGQHNSLVVVAIDFGTTFSGYAFSFTRDANSIHMMRRWEGGDPGVSNQKTPTSLLLKPDGTFHSFGFGARDFYHDLDSNDSKKWLYFDKFKMTLHGSEVTTCLFTV